MPPSLPLYKLRVRFRGVVETICTYCGGYFESELFPRTKDGGPSWRVRCPARGKNPYGCGRIFVPSLHLHEATLSRGRTGVPDDYILPKFDDSGGLSEAFPLGDLHEWRARWPVHQLYVDTSRELLERVEELAKELEALGMQRYTALGQAFEKARTEWQTASIANGQ
jgi:hypothetical protein